ncbi:hypothetical protein GQ53DRAFT_513975 [Thozetella sp. PMI_491]|nr:hypothetical protein GQ53DRAFT_513975 [Thozetella sp. PMI_491]
MDDPTKKKWASHADWGVYKQTIINLYAEKELEEVMEIMEKDHNFYSTRKIYKTKIKEWDVGKRLNDDDMLVILHLRAQREAASKQSEFWLMGKRVNEQNIRRYLKRKPQILTKFQRGHRAPPALGRVTCVTPPPPPDSVRRLPGPLLEGEILFADCRDFWRSSFDSGQWILDPNGVCMGQRAGRWGTDKAENMLSKFYAAADLLSRSDFSGALKVMDLAFRETGQLLKLDVPMMFPTLLLIFRRLDLRSQHDTLNIFRKYIQSQAAALEHGNPRFRSLLQNVCAVEAERYRDILPRLLELMVDASDEMYGVGSSLSFDVYFARFAGYVVREDSTEQVRSLKAELDKLPPDQVRGPWVAKHERLYAWKAAQLLCDQKRYDEALVELKAIEKTFGPDDDTNLSRHWHFVSIVYRNRGDLPDAERYLRRALKVIIMRKGGPDVDSVQFGSAKLAEILDMLGRTEEAENVREYSRNYIEAVASQVHWDWDEFKRRTAVEPVRIPSPDLSATLQASDPGSYAE